MFRLNLPPGVLQRYTQAVQDSYSADHPFTNSTHAADVLQTCHLLLTCAEVCYPGYFDAFDELALLLAAMTHDVKVWQPVLSQPWWK